MNDSYALLRGLLPREITSVGASGPFFSINTDAFRIGVACAWRIEKNHDYAFASGDDISWGNLQSLSGKRITEIAFFNGDRDIRVSLEDGTFIAVFCDTAHDPWRIDIPGKAFITPVA